MLSTTMADGSMSMGRSRQKSYRTRCTGWTSMATRLRATKISKRSSARPAIRKKGAPSEANPCTLCLKYLSFFLGSGAHYNADDIHNKTSACFITWDHQTCHALVGQWVAIAVGVSNKHLLGTEVR